MYIEKIVTTGLLGVEGERVFELNRDLNILTGRNGSGKTTMMKLAWFIISGNILLALREVEFQTCEIFTSEYRCKVIRTGPVHCSVEVTHEGTEYLFEDDDDEENLNPFTEAAEDKANGFVSSIGGSVFFPTFRRIEGGFSMRVTQKRVGRQTSRTKSEVDEALTNLSNRLGNEDHVFVSAISTQDIVQLLLRRYASFSEEISSFQSRVSKEVIEKIRDYEEAGSSTVNARSLLSETRSEIESIEVFRKDIMKPLDAVRELVEKLFHHSGISFGTRLNFGDAADAVNSDVLSAGEKQMLSFICYNAFHKDTVFLIDEPELSLHVDWQRQLFGILESQESKNQFIIATHSPFIYGKYPDKEVAIGLDRGE
ncbi:ATP-binding protein [Tritonibacter scottomollicae]|uniref:ATP-binding protein n=1 Tax=Tritonibacter scottomollicae TaxID=483013 RepID=A0ABZ0HM94_TRISK|nr:ATP-binding protein [Tritonibacter scottomollicae]WOI35026.1 ATP-binding protein [Tritonibacter scottomollicae]